MVVTGENLRDYAMQEFSMCMDPLAQFTGYHTDYHYLQWKPMQPGLCHTADTANYFLLFQHSTNSCWWLQDQQCYIIWHRYCEDRMQLLSFNQPGN